MLEHGPCSQGMAFLLSQFRPECLKCQQGFPLWWVWNFSGPNAFATFNIPQFFARPCQTLTLCMCSTAFSWRSLEEPTPHRQQTSGMKLLPFQYLLPAPDALAAPDSSLYFLSSVDSNVLLCFSTRCCGWEDYHAECQVDMKFTIHVSFLYVRDPAQPIVQCLKMPAVCDCPVLQQLTTGGQIQYKLLHHDQKWPTPTSNEVVLYVANYLLLLDFKHVNNLSVYPLQHP